MVREAAAQSLGRLGDRGTEATLEAVAQSDPKGKVRKAARMALDQVRTRRGGLAQPGYRSQR
jgi:HEAT repeat protein